jgi:phospholipase A1
MKKNSLYWVLLTALSYTVNIAIAAPADQDKPVVVQLDHPAWISLYEPTYLFPFYYTETPYDSVYANNTPNQQRIKKIEVNFQVSFKVPVWHMTPDTQLDMAYTQVSFWQAYNSSPFFRETNYQPELFIQNKLDVPVVDGWRFKYINVGAAHQSNGRGGNLERSWNRVYLNGIFANDNWMISLEPWYAFHDSSMTAHNPDISNYLGYGRELITYKFKGQELSLQARNVFESVFRRGAVQLDWSFPLTSHLKGYVQWFSGYGQSLIEYNHYTNSAGIGIALNDWV